MMHILLTDILGSCRPFAIETENASMARPTPSNPLLKKNKKFHSIQTCLLNLTGIWCGKNKTRNRCAYTSDSGSFSTSGLHVLGVVLAPKHMSLANESKPDRDRRPLC